MRGVDTEQRVTMNDNHEKWKHMDSSEREAAIHQAIRRLCHSYRRHEQTYPPSEPHRIATDLHAPGAKDDTDKPRMGLVLGGFHNALVEVAKVGTYGAAKYSDDGWQHVADGQARYTDAMLRHIFGAGNTDPETGLLHMAHAAWNALAVLELMLRDREWED